MRKRIGQYLQTLPSTRIERERQRERQRETDRERQTERDRERDRQRESADKTRGGDASIGEMKSSLLADRAHTQYLKMFEALLAFLVEMLRCQLET